ncbi:MAG: OmpA family protein [Verrucomicrobiales bacterium]|nr:OmpA family protein [Verrucomicrobiales bacterium]
MNRDAWMIFIALAVTGAVGLLGVAAWRSHQQVAVAQADAAALKQSAAAQTARLAEAWEEVRAARERAEALSEKVATATKSQERLESEMRAALASRDIAISELQGRLTLTILDRILFDSGAAELKPEGMQVLDEIAGILSRFTNRWVQVAGHTDNVPIRVKYASNWELSAARALAAVRHLTEKAGVDPRRVSAVACGEFQPIADNATPEGRARNRRIALVVLPEKFEPSDAAEGAVVGASTNAPTGAIPLSLEPSKTIPAGATNEGVPTLEPREVEGRDLPSP